MNYRQKYNDKRDLSTEFENQMRNIKSYKVGSLELYKSLWQTVLKATPKEMNYFILGRLVLFTLCLVSRIWLGIWFSKMNGYAVKHMINLHLEGLIATMGNLYALSVCSAAVDSYIYNYKYLLETVFRQNLLKYYVEHWMDKNRYYKLEKVLDSSKRCDVLLTSQIKNYVSLLIDNLINSIKPSLEFIVYTVSLIRFSGFSLTTRFFTAILLCYFTYEYINPNYVDYDYLISLFKERISSMLKNVHNNGEEIAFLRGGDFETDKILEANENYYRSAGQFTNTNFIRIFWFNLLNKKFPMQLSHVLVGLSLIKEKGDLMRFGLADTDKVAYEYVRRNSILINWWSSIKKILNLSKDFHHLIYLNRQVENFEDLINIKEQNSKNIVHLEKGLEEPYIDLNNVTIETPSMFTLFKYVNLRFNYLDHSIIMGPNGFGKSSLFRVIAGLWDFSGGKMIVPHSSDLIYVPQRAYFTVGNIVDQIIYPQLLKKEELNAEKVLKIYSLLEKCKLTYLLARYGGLDATVNWTDVLGEGEKQVLSIARLLYNQPKFAILDECTSFIDIENEYYFYDLMLKQGNITLISISHRQSLIKFHTKYVKIDQRRTIKTGLIEEIYHSDDE